MIKPEYKQGTKGRWRWSASDEERNRATGPVYGFDEYNDARADFESFCKDLIEGSAAYGDLLESLETSEQTRNELTGKIEDLTSSLDNWQRVASGRLADFKRTSKLHTEVKKLLSKAEEKLGHTVVEHEAAIEELKVQHSREVATNAVHHKRQVDQQNSIITTLQQNLEEARTPKSFWKRLKSLFRL